jgi:hypothetical protein
VFVVRPQAGALERRLGPVRLAGECVGAVDLVLADGVAEEDGEDDKPKPAEDRGLAVRRAPVAGTGGEVLPFDTGSLPRESRTIPAACPTLFGEPLWEQAGLTLVAPRKLVDVLRDGCGRAALGGRWGGRGRLRCDLGFSHGEGQGCGCTMIVVH